MPSTAKVKLAFTCKISPRKFWWLLSPPRRVMGLLGHPTANKSPHHQHLNKATNTSNWASRTSYLSLLQSHLPHPNPISHQISLWSHKHHFFFFPFCHKCTLNFPEKLWAALELWHVSTNISLWDFFVFQYSDTSREKKVQGKEVIWPTANPVWHQSQL